MDVSSRQRLYGVFRYRSKELPSFLGAAISQPRSTLAAGKKKGSAEHGLSRPYGAMHELEPGIRARLP